MRCCIAPSWSAICTSVRSADITCASARASGSKHFLDPESLVELADDIEPEDPLKFRDSKKYRDRLLQAQKSDAGEGCADRDGRHAARACRSWPARSSSQFLGGSMGSVVGERFVRARRALPRASQAAGVLLRERRRAHAGSAAVAAADGEDERRARAPGASAVCRTFPC